MARIFITGSADGLGQLTAKALIEMGHQVVLHARNEARAKQALEQAQAAEDVLIADLSDIEATKALAAKANDLGCFDVVLHNAGVYQVRGSSERAKGLPIVFAVNSLAPYILTALMHPPKRLIYMSSGMHLQGDPDMEALARKVQTKIDSITYSDTKLHDVILSMAVARSRSNTYSNAIDPGWVPTKMGGAGAPDDLDQGFETQVWLSVSNEAGACVSGRYFHHKRESRFLQAAKDPRVQQRFLGICEEVTGVKLLPEG